MSVSCSGCSWIWKSWKLGDSTKVFLIFQVQIYVTNAEIMRRWQGDLRHMEDVESINVEEEVVWIKCDYVNIKSIN